MYFFGELEFCKARSFVSGCRASLIALHPLVVPPTTAAWNAEQSGFAVLAPLSGRVPFPARSCYRPLAAEATELAWPSKRLADAGRVSYLEPC